MPTTELLELMNVVYLAKFNSLAAYIAAAEPYVAPGEESLLQTVNELAAEDARLEQELSALYATLEVFPLLAPHEAFVSELNYLSIKYLCTVLENDLKKQLEVLKKAITKATEEKADAVAGTLSSVEQKVQAELARLSSSAPDNLI